jgi:hypothetical protein
MTPITVDGLPSLDPSLFLGKLSAPFLSLRHFNSHNCPMDQDQLLWESFVGVGKHLNQGELLSLDTVNAYFSGVVGQQFYTYWISGGSRFKLKM